MTLRQTLLKIFYPLIMKARKIAGSKNLVLYNSTNANPKTSFYNLRERANNGSELNFEQFKGKKVLVVNTASDCGYTRQYEELENLYKKYNKSLVVLGFPANDFKEQEKGSDEEIAQFCRINYGVTFPLVKKSTVIKSHGQNPVFQWLTDKNKNGWNDHQPVWNFSKYLVSEEGKLIYYFDPSVSPVSDVVTNALSKH
jgi:glutathione peroxidase